MVNSSLKYFHTLIVLETITCFPITLPCWIKTTTKANNAKCLSSQILCSEDIWSNCGQGKQKVTQIKGEKLFLLGNILLPVKMKHVRKIWSKTRSVMLGSGEEEHRGQCRMGTLELRWKRVPLLRRVLSQERRKKHCLHHCSYLYPTTT